MVVKNEVDRYLEKCLRHMSPFLDELFIWDDQSVDGTPDLCKFFTEHVYVRPDNIPSFLEHEGQFRSAAWAKMVEVLNPDSDVWILSFDCDEFLVSEDNERDSIDQAITAAGQALSIRIHFPEIFKVEEDEIWYRTDGYWGNINGTRLFRYLDNARWSDKAMGCGSEPTYVSEGLKSDVNYGLNMLHFGYAYPEDQQKKYQRYTNLYDHGHSNSHIQSIIQPPTLEKWQGKVPVFK